MFSTLITVALFVSLAIRGASAGFAINNAQLVQCQPVQISWAPNVAPYQIEVVPANDPCGEALDTISDLTGTVLQYSSKIASGTQVVLYISDANGNEAWSGNITVGTSSSNSCMPGVSSIALSTNPSTPVTSSAPVASKGASSGNPLGGAINAGSLTSGAFSVRQASTPLLTLTALAAMLALTL